ncbi:DNA-directed RNA polymerases I, II, and III subunit RPABC3 [Trichomonascus vanleenenianus]|uniref:DNA-directed RNA polymerase core subunit RPB8 n=1 Tax=Trichomonascus vanleenenianus TaxID=2268995 RepID=UPI003ECAC039
MSATLFDDIFKITSVDSARYDRVSRIQAQSVASSDVRLILDVNSELFPVAKNQTLTVAIAQTLSLDGNEEESVTSWRESKPGDHTLADEYDYVMYGVIYKFEESAGDKINVYCSFGGLIMCLEGNYRKLSNLKQDNIYLLMRR